MDALGDPTRRAIFERLAQGPTAVTELANELPVSRPAVSQHLKVLREAGLVAVRAERQRRLYVVRPEGLASVEAFLAELWPDSLQRLKRAVESGDG
jgi:DNA-binding transcriptional ArsR family regulator